MKKYLLCWMFALFFSCFVIVPATEVEAASNYHYDDNLGIYVIDSSCVLMGTTLYGDVYVSEDAVLSLYYSSIYGTVYVYGGLEFDSSSYVTELIAGSMSWSSTNSYSRGEVKVSGSLMAGTNYSRMSMSIARENVIPIHINDNLVLVDDGILKVSGSYANAIPMMIEGYGEVETDSNGVFDINDIDIGNVDTITLSWTWAGNPSNKITKVLDVTKGTIDTEGKINYSPLISANDIILNIGEEYDFASHVSAIDAEDGDLTKSVLVDLNDLDITKRGTYTVKYTVEDSIGQKIEKDIQVTVVDPKVISISFYEECLVKDCTTTSFELVPNVVVQDNPEYKLMWDSSNEEVLKVDSDGIVTVLGVGSAVVTVKVDDMLKAIAEINIEHIWNNEYTVDVEPTCVVEGSKSIHCTKCGIMKQDSIEVIEATGHLGGTATCKTKAVCETCREGYGELEKNMHVGETEVRDAKEVTCSEEGYTGDTYCKDCGTKTASGKAIEKLTTHTWNAGVVTKEATTTEKGEKTYTCTVCYTTRTEEVDALGLPKVGTVDMDDSGKAKYKITKSDLTNGTVTYIAPTLAIENEIIVPDTVIIHGITYKVTAIEKSAFKNNKKIKKLTLGSNVKSIGANAFYNCQKLKSVNIGKNVTTIGDKAFYKCTSLAKITISSKVTKIGKSAFDGCKKLNNITMTAGKLKTIGKNAFKGINKKASFRLKGTKKAKITLKKKLMGKKIGYVKTWKIK